MPDHLFEQRDGLADLLALFGSVCRRMVEWRRYLRPISIAEADFGMEGACETVTDHECRFRQWLDPALGEEFSGRLIARAIGQQAETADKAGNPVHKAPQPSDRPIS